MACNTKDCCKNTNLDKEVQLKEKVGAWAKFLGVGDWRLSVRYGRRAELDHAEGRCEIMEELKTADIIFLDPIDYRDSTDWPTDEEAVIVHELLHLHTAGFEPPHETREFVAMEQMIELCSVAYAKLVRGEKPY